MTHRDDTVKQNAVLKDLPGHSGEADFPASAFLFCAAVVQQFKRLIFCRSKSIKVLRKISVAGSEIKRKFLKSGAGASYERPL
jgi:hypothetical protein